MKNINDQRREFLINALSAGLYATGSMGVLQPVWAMGKVPRQLVPGKSIYDLRGNVLVNGRQASENTRIDFNSTVETGPSSHVIFAVGKDAFILRSNSKVKIEGNNGLIGVLRLVTGKMLSVFGRRAEKQKLGIKTVAATIGIRGTGVYVESEPEQTYVCTCYGVADLYSNKDKTSKERVITRHHDAPRFILPNEPTGKQIIEAPVFNHTDDELALIETLVGRTVPFAAAGYGAPRKSAY